MAHVAGGVGKLNMVSSHPLWILHSVPAFWLTTRCWSHVVFGYLFNVASTQFPWSVVPILLSRDLVNVRLY